MDELKHSLKPSPTCSSTQIFKRRLSSLLLALAAVEMIWASGAHMLTMGAVSPSVSRRSCSRLPRILPDDRPGEFVGPVGYTGREVLEPFRAPIQKAAEIFSAAMETNPNIAQNEVVRSMFMQALVRDLIASPMIWRCLTLKHPAYEHEREVRLLIMGTPEALRPYVATRFRGSEIVPYIAQAMPIRERNSIIEIMVGPAAPPDTKRTLQTMLTSLGVVVDFIHHSEIPYRAV